MPPSHREAKADLASAVAGKAIAIAFFEPRARSGTGSDGEEAYHVNNAIVFALGQQCFLAIAVVAN